MKFRFISYGAAIKKAAYSGFFVLKCFIEQPFESGYYYNRQ